MKAIAVAVAVVKPEEWGALQVVEGRGAELRNVPKAVHRGRKINCKVCLGNGATLGCNVKACRNSYHLPCALAKGCLLEVRACHRLKSNMLESCW